LNKKSFNANDWFNSNHNGHNITNSQSLYSKHLADFTSFSKNAPKNNINQYFVPGWNGESLISKTSKVFVDVLEKTTLDINNTFKRLARSNNRLKNSIYEEFMAFAEFKAYNFTGINNSQDFWKEVESSHSNSCEKLQEFIRIYSFRTASIYLLKIRFICFFLKNNSLNIETKHVLYPNSLLTSVFRKGSSTEINAKSLEQNIYSWYKPSNHLESDIKKLTSVYHELEITQIVKSLSLAQEEILNKNSEYSHSLSQKTFGLFLNSLLINFPLWLNRFNQRFRNSFKLDLNGMEVISCKYKGDFLESMALSHWVAQESNKNIKWNEILCPSFDSSSFETGLYTKITNELHFLTFLTGVAKSQGQNVTKFICDVMRSYLNNKKDSNVLQKNLFFDPTTNTSSYDRIILNINKTPKNNAQHFIINQINQNCNKIKDNGLIFVFSDKKIFLPSQKDKLENFLKIYHLEGLFNFETLKGKGKLGSYLYIFSKNQSFKDVREMKKTFLNFRYTGELVSFNDFSNITQMTQNFFLSNLSELPSMAHKEHNNFQLEFFQDAIIGGRLMHTSSSDSTKVTHPKFFNSLMKSCQPFDYFFEVNSLKEEIYESSTSLGLNFSYNEQNPILIVNMRSKESTLIEIIERSSYESKLELYGKSLCYYFEIIPKWHDINLESIKSFFDSTIGRQIIDLTFNNQLRRTKANLKKLMVPSFLIKNKSIPEHISPGLQTLDLNINNILEMHPTKLKDSVVNTKGLIINIASEYPSIVISKLSNFKRKLKICLDRFEYTKSNKIINFNNPLIKTPLLLAKTYELYPNNPDIFTEFNSDNNQSFIHKELTKTKIVKSIIEEQVSYGLELYNKDTLIATLYSDIEMLQFIDFILSNITNVPISSLIQAVKVPRLEDLKSVIRSFKLMNSTISSIYDDLNLFNEQILNKIISDR
jgi:hypothetical protein